LLGNIELAALNDYRPHLIGALWMTLNQLLYLDREQEGAIAFPWQTCSMCNKTCHSVELLALKTDYPNIPDGELLEYCHRATQIESGTNSKADLPETRKIPGR